MEKQIDVSYLMENFDYEDGSVKEMIDIIFRDLPTKMEQLGRAVNSNDPEEAFSIAHSMKSSLKMLGLLRILHHIVSIEDAARNRKNLTPFKDAMAQAQALLHMAHKEVSEWK